MLKNLARRFVRYVRNRRATAGVEFAIGAPMLLGGLIIMTDIGLAFSQQMNLDQAIRSGAEFVMGDTTDEATIEDMVAAAAVGRDPNDPNDVSPEDFPTVDAVRFCKCPGSTTPVSCTVLCTPSNTPPSIYYNLTASKTYNSLFLPDFNLETTIRVQVR